MVGTYGQPLKVCQGENNGPTVKVLTAKINDSHLRSAIFKQTTQMSMSELVNVWTDQTNGSVVKFITCLTNCPDVNV